MPNLLGYISDVDVGITNLGLPPTNLLESLNQGIAQNIRDIRDRRYTTSTTHSFRTGVKLNC
jgi:hypothetical protein